MGAPCGGLHHLVENKEELLHAVLLAVERNALLGALLLQVVELLPELTNQLVKLGVGCVVSLQLRVDLADLLLHRGNLVLSRLNLLLELLDLVVQDELEFFELLVFLLELVDALLLLLDGDVLFLREKAEDLQW